MLVRRGTPEDVPAIIALVQGLEGWFDEHARAIAIPTDVKHQTVFVASEGEELLGFVSLYVMEGRLNIGWIGVRRDWHRRGVGSALMARTEAHARELGLGTLAVYTLGDGVDYEPYERTRQFYYKHGFRITRRSKTDSEACPELIDLAKQVGLE